MALHTATTFRTSFPEFTSAPTTLIEEKLAEAATQIDQTLWDAKAIFGHGYLTAHLLALTPFGNTAKLVNAAGSTTYEGHYRRLRGIVTSGIRNT